MRLWTLHPMYLDSSGLTAAWREALLAQKVLAGLTKGYTKHPQLLRFLNTDNPALYIAHFLQGLYEESVRRGYSFDGSKIGCFYGAESDIRNNNKITQIPAGNRQVLYEKYLLTEKLARRCPEKAPMLSSASLPFVHPLFTVISGGIETWEKVIPDIVKKIPPCM